MTHVVGASLPHCILFTLTVWEHSHKHGIILLFFFLPRGAHYFAQNAK